MEQNSILGCLVAGAVGDAYGRPYELQKSPQVDFGSIQKFEISDDTQLTLATCEAILAEHAVSPNAIAVQMCRWFEDDRISGIGKATFHALKELSFGRHWSEVGRKGERAAGNGSAMRIAPLGFILDIQNESHQKTISEVCRITHQNDEAYYGALAVLHAIQIIHSKPKLRPAQLLNHVAGYIPDSKIQSRFLTLIQNQHLSITDMGRTFGASGYVVDSVPLAVFAAAHIHQLEFSQILQQAIEAGGDTDTVASISGQIMGAALGLTKQIHTMFQNINNHAAYFDIIDSFATFCTSQGRKANE